MGQNAARNDATPVGPDSRGSNPSPADRDRELDANRRPHVIVADDDEALRELLGHRLRQSGLWVTEARDGQELLRILAGLDDDDAPALLITDVHMPGASGLTGLTELRRRWPQAPAIVITAFRDDKVDARARALGADLVLDKPLDVAR